MKALSLKRPWPFCIFHLGKRIENRSDKRGEPPMCRYRGWLLLHAGKGWDESVFKRHSHEVSCLADIECFPSEMATQAMAILPHGRSYRDRHSTGIVGRARVVGQVHPDGSTPEDVWIRFVGDQKRWWQGGHAMILDDVEELPEPILWRGRQGLWTPPDEVRAQLPPRWLRDAEVER